MGNSITGRRWMRWAAPILVLAGIGGVVWLLAGANPAAEPTAVVASRPGYPPEGYSGQAPEGYSGQAPEEYSGQAPTVQYRMAQVKTATPLPAATARATATSAPRATATGTPTLVPTLPAPPTSSIQASLNAVDRIAPDAARAQVEAGAAVFVDVRSEAAYQHGHLPGAILMPGGVPESGYDDLPDDRLLIFYCA